ncbi:hypothetical protein AXF42_Ash008882 [Apostasia shenzhenica]|uniref:WRKY domain-containing protein n=1 Tax=Apostasia shenzhenica TaxID=1088818 RepID=A0A2I0ASS5_9ASPA|nr:hypothetical protein AXF42_Ash008882 [Apostasia shenzhenica]
MAFSLAKPSSAGHRDALNELARGRHEASAVVRSLLGWHSPPPGDGWRSEIECSTASGEVLSYSAGNPMAAGVPGDGEGGSGNDAGGLHGRKHSDSWTTVSCAPYDDGYHWRKYGEKKISKTKYTSLLKEVFRDFQKRTKFSERWNSSGILKLELEGVLSSLQPGSIPFASRRSMADVEDGLIVRRFFPRKLATWGNLLVTLQSQIGFCCNYLVPLQTRPAIMLPHHRNSRWPQAAATPTSTGPTDPSQRLLLNIFFDKS